MNITKETRNNINKIKIQIIQLMEEEEVLMKKNLDSKTLVIHSSGVIQGYIDILEILDDFLDRSPTKRYIPKWKQSRL